MYRYISEEKVRGDEQKKTDEQNYLANPNHIFYDDSEDEGEVLYFLCTEAVAGNPRAQFIVGDRYSRTEGGLEEGIRLIGISAKQGCELSQKRLEQLYEMITDFSDPRDLMKWIREFANLGIPDAQYKYADWLDKNKKTEDAFKWMLEAANSGHAAAQEQVAHFYMIADADQQAAARSFRQHNTPNKLNSSSDSQLSSGAFSEEEIFKIENALKSYQKTGKHSENNNISESPQGSHHAFSEKDVLRVITALRRYNYDARLIRRLPIDLKKAKN